MSFDNLGLTEMTLKAVRSEGYHTATPIQMEAIPPILRGRDMMGCAQTGTGKTAAFALPTLERLAHARSRSKSPGDRSLGDRSSGDRSSGDRSLGERSLGTRTASVPTPSARPQTARRPIRALVLAPTRELSAQIADSFAVYGRYSGLRHAVIYGGVSQRPQVRLLQAGVDILVATPGRLLDLMQQGYVDLSSVEILILDEADQMLDLGFIQPLRRIVSQVPRRRQTLMFSATMPNEIRQLVGEWLREPVHVQVTPVSTPVEKIKQSVYHVESNQKAGLLVQLLKGIGGKSLIFTRTKRGADRVSRYLNVAGVAADAIHGDKSQGARQQALERFKSDESVVLVATDIAARGLDIDAISHVVNYDLPNTPETYVHRIGRTARAGAAGTALSFCSNDERQQLRDIERLTRRTIDVEPLPAGFSRDTAQAERGAARRASTGHQAGSRSTGGRPTQRSGSVAAGPRLTQKAAGHSGEKRVQGSRPTGNSGNSNAKKSRGFRSHGNRPAHGYASGGGPKSPKKGRRGSQRSRFVSN